MQFRVGHRLSSIGQGDGVGACGHLRREQLVYALVLRVGGRRLVPVEKNPTPLLRRDHLQAADEGLRIV